MSLTFKLKMVFSVLCFFFKPASWHLLLYQYRSIHFDRHISKEHSPIESVFHVPLLYFEHLPLQRSLHGPDGLGDCHIINALFDVSSHSFSVLLQVCVVVVGGRLFKHVPVCALKAVL